VSPEYSKSLRQRIADVVALYPVKEAALLPVLHLVQREAGSISPAEEKFIAGILDIKPMKVREVTTFYSMILRQPLGKYHIQVCSNLSCSILGAGTVIDYLKEKLGIGIGETTLDKKFSLSTVECLGACEQAPCLMVNFDYHGNLDEEKIDKLLASLT
jgi:NADH-quinone oxidoreductase subunit E